jgi:hypothetical protein
MTPVGRPSGMKERSSNREEQRFHTTRAKLVVMLVTGLRAANYLKLVSRLCSIQLNYRLKGNEVLGIWVWKRCELMVSRGNIGDED